MQENKQGAVRILGIDPGTQVTGFGIIDIVANNKIELCEYGCIKPDRKNTLPYRLMQIFTGLTEIIEKYNPDQVALEDIFYSENIKTAIVMGHARGVSLLATVLKGMNPAEYSPREVKLAVVGNGAASKNQVQFMVRQILGLKEDIEPYDAADAIAVAICHHHRSSRLSLGVKI